MREAMPSTEAAETQVALRFPNLAQPTICRRMFRRAPFAKSGISPRSPGEIPDFANGALRNILRQIVGCARFGNLNATCVSAASVEGMASRIVHVHSVDDEIVVVEPGHEGRSGGGPKPVRALHHVKFRVAPKVELYRRGIRGVDTELGSAAGVDARIFRAPHIRGSWLKTVSGLCVAAARK